MSRSGAPPSGREARPLDPATVPLDGITLIEASAGTGKTHAIGSLYLRLIAERGLPVDAILVLTFTNAATAELRARLRTRLVAARAALRTADGSEADEPVLVAALARVGERATVEARLGRAIAELDLAAVHTIHGFCQRVLSEHAFESGTAFERDLLADDRGLVGEVVDDFWRREVVAATPEEAAAALAARLDPGKLAAFAVRHLGRPELAVHGGEPVDVAALRARARATTAAVRVAWGDGRAGLAAAIEAAPGLDRRRLRRDVVERALRTIDDALAVDAVPATVPKGLERLTPDGVALATRAGEPPPEHPLLPVLGAWHAALVALEAGQVAWTRALLVRLLAFAGPELARRKRARAVMSYGDLLLDLDAALAGEGGEGLARALSERFRVALVDEFQDTDPVQYRILSRVFARPGHGLILVGDPKQAIYGFRGADVFAYLAAKRDVDRAWTLGENWRSVPTLVEAVNAVLGRGSRPFLLDGIDFRPVAPAARAAPMLAVDGDEPTPLVLWTFGPEPGAKPLTKTAARAAVAEAVAGEVARLLALAATGRARIGERSLAGGDIAILVRRNTDGRRAREALARRGVAAVLRSPESVLDSPEAEELERLLLAVAEPADPGLARAAGATALVGMEAATLARTLDDDAELERLLDRFQRWHDAWRRNGFAPMLRRVMDECHTARRLLAIAGGERALTNYRHLGELAQEVAETGARSPEQLARWLVARRAEPGAGEAAELRLESDENLVQILTIHRSKGLEYPVVLCPDLWDAGKPLDGDEPLVWHDVEAGGRESLHLGPAIPPEIVTAARGEALAETLRLAYVALTRASCRLYVAWGGAVDAGASGLARLLHPPATPDDATPIAVDDWPARVAECAELAATVPGSIAVHPLPRPDHGPQTVPRVGSDLARLEARTFPGALSESRRVTSFTALASHDPRDDGRDHDAHRGPPGPVGGAPGQGMHAFPRGARAGTCLHAVLERLDFPCADHARIEAVAREQLAAHGIDTAWAGDVASGLAAVLDTPLVADAAIRLRDVPAAARVVELEFHFPVTRLRDSGLARVLSSHGHDGAAASLRFAPISGFVRGFVDLVMEAGGRYWIVDYKSNWLGPGADDYAAALLPPVMDREGYRLQYLLYTVAVSRYLRLRVPGYDQSRHFGGVLYLFLRGMEPRRGADQGVFHDCPTPTLVRALDDYLAGGGR
ncbi:MAG: exodeoxyribonuclease V subunit beta [Ectothiorhodospiraceae bacterium]|nr:exodeoxyribonuclease V subunit beta [Chromatiales bacterium]MCP5155417.1 exodeoxyribonuclease V subunit beta [Ectothiorhodospiraceae bacterium]